MASFGQKSRLIVLCVSFVIDELGRGTKESRDRFLVARSMKIKKILIEDEPLPYRCPSSRKFTELPATAATNDSFATTDQGGRVLL